MTSNVEGGRGTVKERRLTSALPERTRRCTCSHAAVDIVLSTTVRVERRVEPVVDERWEMMSLRTSSESNVPSTPALLPVKLPRRVT